jgi:hypothetical protein
LRFTRIAITEEKCASLHCHSPRGKPGHSSKCENDGFFSDTFPQLVDLTQAASRLLMVRNEEKEGIRWILEIQSRNVEMTPRWKTEIEARMEDLRGLMTT